MQRIITVTECDITGESSDIDEYTFVVGDRTYKLDLSQKPADDLTGIVAAYEHALKLAAEAYETALQPFLAAAGRVARLTATPTATKGAKAVASQPKPARRVFTWNEKRRIVAEYVAGSAPERAALCEREELYDTMVSRWRREIEDRDGGTRVPRREQKPKSLYHAASPAERHAAREWFLGRGEIIKGPTPRDEQMVRWRESLESQAPAKKVVFVAPPKGR